MDVKTSFAAQTYAQARTAAAPKPGTGEGSGVWANLPATLPKRWQITKQRPAPP